MFAFSLSLIFSYTDGHVESRRGIFQKGAAIAAGIALGAPQKSNAYTLPDLPYPFEALEPYIDTPTMKIHHDKHHGTFSMIFNNNRSTIALD